jgi:hypothetical protein
VFFIFKVPNSKNDDKPKVCIQPTSLSTYLLSVTGLSLVLSFQESNAPKTIKKTESLKREAERDFSESVKVLVVC